MDQHPLAPMPIGNQPQPAWPHYVPLPVQPWPKPPAEVPALATLAANKFRDEMAKLTPNQRLWMVNTASENAKKKGYDACAMALIRKVALEEYIAHDAREELLKPQLTMLIAVQSKELLLLEKGRINDVWESNHDGLDKIIDYDFRANAISNRDTWEDNDYIIGQLADGKVKSDRDIPRGAFRHLIEEFLESSQWKTFSINDDNWEKAWNFLNYIYDAVENTRLAQRTAEKDPLEFQMYLDQLPFESLPVDT